MMGMGIWEWIVILVIILIIFGAGKLPEIGEGLGKAIKSFKKATQDEDNNGDSDNRKEDKSST